MEKNDKSIMSPVAILLIIAALAIGYLFARVQNLEQTAGKDSAKVAGEAVEAEEGQPEAEFNPDDLKKASKDDHIRGGTLEGAKIALVQYSDLECPFCKTWHETTIEAGEEYGKDLAIIFRHFPIDSLHSQSDKEAEATECAGKIGGNDSFWAMLDKIYEVTPSNNGLDMDKLPEYAAELGIDKAKFSECLESGEMADAVEEQYQSGIKAGIAGTPGSFLVDLKSGDVQQIPGALPLDSLKAEIDKMMK